MNIKSTSLTGGHVVSWDRAPTIAFHLGQQRLVLRKKRRDRGTRSWRIVASRWEQPGPLSGPEPHPAQLTSGTSWPAFVSLDVLWPTTPQRSPGGVHVGRRTSLKSAQARGGLFQSGASPVRGEKLPQSYLKTNVVFSSVGNCEYMLQAGRRPFAECITW